MLLELLVPLRVHPLLLKLEVLLLLPALQQTHLPLAFLLVLLRKLLLLLW